MEYGINLKDSQFQAFLCFFSLATFKQFRNISGSHSNSPVARKSAAVATFTSSRFVNLGYRFRYVEFVAKLHDSGRHDVTYLVA